MQPDPLGIGAADLSAPQSLNLYGYVANDPVNFVDPRGLLAIFCTPDTMTCDPNTGVCTIRAGECHLVGGGSGVGGGLTFGGGGLSGGGIDPQTGGGGGGGAQNKTNKKPPCPPTVSELLNNKTVRTALYQALAETTYKTGVEEGGWVYWNSRTGDVTTRKAPSGMRTGLPGLNSPPKINGYLIVADFHTHPVPQGLDYDAFRQPPLQYFESGPSGEDRRRADFLNTPGIVVPISGKPEAYGPARVGANPALAAYPERLLHGYAGANLDTTNCK
jgi:hypothetical protein